VTVFAEKNGSPWQKFHDRHCYSSADNYLNVMQVRAYQISTAYVWAHTLQAVVLVANLHHAPPAL